MLSMGMHYPREVPVPNTKIKPSLPRGLTLCEIQALNTADGNEQQRPQREGENEGHKANQPRPNHSGDLCKPPRRAGSDRNRSCHNRARTSTARSKTGSRSSVTSFKAPGAENVNLQHVPSRRSSLEAGVCLQSSLCKDEDSGLSIRCQNDNCYLRGDSFSSASASASSKGNFGEVLSVDQKRLHFR